MTTHLQGTEPVVSTVAQPIAGSLRKAGTKLAALKNPSMAGVLETVTGSWGALLISFGLIISVGGALLAWTLLAEESVCIAYGFCMPLAPSTCCSAPCSTHLVR